MNNEVPWGDLAKSDISIAMSTLEDECRKESVSESIVTHSVIEWRLYVLHKQAVKTFGQRNRKVAGTDTSMIQGAEANSL